jgi:hypothetical protein
MSKTLTAFSLSTIVVLGLSAPAFAQSQSAKPDNPSGFGSFTGNAASGEVYEGYKGNEALGRSSAARNDYGSGAAGEVSNGRSSFGSTPNPPAHSR